MRVRGGRVEVPVSYGELVDKLTILEIKSERITDPTKRANVVKELELLEAVWRAGPASAQGAIVARARLKAINEKLWDIEDRIRRLEAAATFDQEFIELARSVYYTNDQRAAVKREINLSLGSELVEEKFYQPYPAPDG